eukprot:tig00020685_g12940.t1
MGALTEEQRARAEANRQAALAKLAANRAAAAASQQQQPGGGWDAAPSPGSSQSPPTTTASCSNSGFDLALVPAEPYAAGGRMEAIALHGTNETPWPALSASQPLLGQGGASSLPAAPSSSPPSSSQQHSSFTAPDHTRKFTVHISSCPTAGPATVCAIFTSYRDALGALRAMDELIECGPNDVSIFQLVDAIERLPAGARVAVVSDSARLQETLQRSQSSASASGPAGFGARLQKAMTARQISLQFGQPLASSGDPGASYLQRMLAAGAAQRLSRLEQQHGGLRTVEELLARVQSAADPQAPRFSPSQPPALPAPASQPPSGVPAPWKQRPGAPARPPSQQPWAPPQQSQWQSEPDAWAPSASPPALAAVPEGDGEEDFGGRAVAPHARQKRLSEQQAARGGKRGKREPVFEPELSDEQRYVVEQVLEGRNVFVTGSAGTGKSFLLRRAIDVLRRERGMQASLAITAPTGIAATMLGGCTVHAWAGVGLGKESKETLASRVEGSRRALARWERTLVLVIDEVSMLDGDLFEKLDYIGRTVRRSGSGRPFGGIQLVLVGDFLQLPPVTVGSDVKRFAFETEAWAKAGMVNIELKRVFRQRDADFVAILNELRFGRVSPATAARLAACQRNDPSGAGQAAAAGGNGNGSAAKIETTRLFCRKANVEAENTGRLEAIREQAQTYAASDSGSEPYKSQLINNCPAPANLVLKKGAQVMLLQNLDQQNGLVNGSRGVVEEFRSVNGLHIPHVKFLNQDIRGIEPHVWSVELDGVVLAQRKQIPLMLAWSMTIHKSQGMTIDSLEISLKGVFEYGQAYVALSRATSLETLRLLDFDPRCVRAHPRVLQFYNSFISAGPAYPRPAPALALPPPASSSAPALPAPQQRQPPRPAPQAPAQRPAPVPQQRPSRPPPAHPPRSRRSGGPSRPLRRPAIPPPVRRRRAAPAPLAPARRPLPSPRSDGRRTRRPAPPRPPRRLPTGGFSPCAPWEDPAAPAPRSASPPVINFRRGTPPHLRKGQAAPAPGPARPPTGPQRLPPTAAAGRGKENVGPLGGWPRPGPPKTLEAKPIGPPAGRAARALGDASILADAPARGSFYDV